MISIGEHRIVGQEKVRNELARIIDSNRIGHAYLFSGPTGVGKLALALAFAEAINGVENLSILGDLKKSTKSNWFVHPDIHVFIPQPKAVTSDELPGRLQLLAKDPYAIIDFARRPKLEGDSDGKNKNAFYGVDYFNDTIRPTMRLKPNEGRRNIVILANIEKMKPNIANTFLKTLEEPAENLMFILTTDNFNALLPTIISRCQNLRCGSLSGEQISTSLIQKDGYTENDARFLSRVSGGNYASTRFYDVMTLRENRKQVIHFLRMSYTQDAPEIIKLANRWHAEFNNEGHVAMLNIIEVFLRDLAIYMKSQDASLLTNADQAEVIHKFTASLQDARIEEMINTLNSYRPFIVYNAQAKLIYTTMAIRFSYLMRGIDTPIPASEPWQHFPATTFA